MPYACWVAVMLRRMNGASLALAFGFTENCCTAAG